jgi:hypothetical protein
MAILNTRSTVPLAWSVNEALSFQFSVSGTFNAGIASKVVGSGATCYELRAPGENFDTRYARSGDLYVAYRVFGQGPFDLVFASGLDFPSVEFHDHA